MDTTVAQVLARFGSWFPPATAQSWDAVGTVCGDPTGPARRVLLAVDVTSEVVAEAVDRQVDLVIAHHPLLLKGVHGIDVAHPKGRMVHDLITAGIVLHCAHTNADIGPYGTVESLAAALGVTDRRPLRPTGAEAMDTLVTHVPADHVDAVVTALSEAGAGAVGDYERCFFAAPGTGSFRPLPGAEPFLGTVDEVAEVAEQRVELVLPRHRRDAVVRALLQAHPYEEPSWQVLEHAEVSLDRGLGRIGSVAPTTVGEFARLVADTLPETAAGLRVAGELDRPVRTVAVQAGAGDDLLDTARSAGADLYLTSDLRHHPASEAAQWPDGPALIDVPHWAAEWMWLPVLESKLCKEFEGLEVHVSTIPTDPWTAHVNR
ncbi:Nif3-like dinuclear metal center hexameric protein [Propionibacteriaceae bacterium Y1700]|uniref:Nif3-like dinuclear metal center hexameric protein n=1 Tax=Microlunatus sp. Y1700 TaxID=3418487 RepID=UPI003DA70D34